MRERGVFGVAFSLTHTQAHQRNDKTSERRMHTHRRSPARAVTVYWIPIGILCLSFLSLSAPRRAELLTFDCAAANAPKSCSQIIKASSRSSFVLHLLEQTAKIKKRNNFYGERVDFIDSCTTIHLPFNFNRFFA